MPPNIANLPPEILGIIFKNLDKANDLRRASQTCKAFYRAIRYQSKAESTLQVAELYPEWSLTQIFQNSTPFPFSKLRIESHNLKFKEAPNFWLLYGEEFTEITIKDCSFNVCHFLTTWSNHFPKLRRLTIIEGFCCRQMSGARDFKLPIEELHLEFGLDWTLTLRLLRAAPALKKLVAKVDNVSVLRQLIPWTEKIECVWLNVELIPLQQLIEVPSKVVFIKLHIKSNCDPNTFAEFFAQPRLIETLEWTRVDAQSGISALINAKLIRNMQINHGWFPESEDLDLLAQLNGLETISINAIDDIHLYEQSVWPYFHWTKQEIGTKIRSIKQRFNIPLDWFRGLDHLTALTILEPENEYWKNYALQIHGLSTQDLQTLAQHCPNLKELRVLALDVFDDELLPILSLQNLEILSILKAPKITINSFKNAFKFPRLKEFHFRSHKLNIALQHLTVNCPNLEKITLIETSPEGLEHLARYLPYLTEVKFVGDDHLKCQDKVDELKMEMPYLKVTFEKQAD